MDKIVRQKIIATEITNISFFDKVFHLVPERYRQDVILNNRIRVMQEIRLGKFFIYVDFAGKLNWTTNIEESWSDEYTNYQFINNEAFLFLLELVYGDIVKR